MANVILALGQPIRISVGRLSLEEKGELLLREDLRLDEGVGQRSVAEINDFFEEYGLDFETLDLEGPGVLGLDVEGIKKQAVSLPLKRPPQGDYLIFKRFLVSGQEFVGKFVFPFDIKSLRWECLIPFVLDLDEFCGAGSLMVGFFYVEDPQHRFWLAEELRRVPAKKQRRFLSELDAALASGRLPHGPTLPGKITFHDLVPLEKDFEEKYEALLMEVQEAEIDCHSLEVVIQEPIEL